MAHPAFEPRRINADTFFNLPDDGHRYELIDGEVEMAPAPSADYHQFTVGMLHLALAPFVIEHRLGLVLLAPTDVILSAYDVVEPDLLFVRAERELIVGGRIHGAPDLVVEVLSPTTAEFDLGLKMRRYAKFGVPWYWSVDPENRTLRELELVEGAYVERSYLEGNALFQPLLFPGLTIDLGQVWPRPRRHAEAE